MRDSEFKLVALIWWQGRVDPSGARYWEGDLEHLAGAPAFGTLYGQSRPSGKPTFGIVRKMFDAGYLTTVGLRERRDGMAWNRLAYAVPKFLDSQVKNNVANNHERSLGTEASHSLARAQPTPTTTGTTSPANNSPSDNNNDNDDNNNCGNNNYDNKRPLDREAPGILEANESSESKATEGMPRVPGREHAERYSESERNLIARAGLEATRVRNVDQVLARYPINDILGALQCVIGAMEAHAARPDLEKRVWSPGGFVMTLLLRRTHFEPVDDLSFRRFWDHGPDDRPVIDFVSWKIAR